jgi:hypothetical protein
MKTIIGHLAFTFFYILFSMTTVFGQSPLNVHDFGATGDGTTDDAPAINKALKAAATRKKDLYFPSGTYLCNTISDAQNHILLFRADGLKGIKLYGDGVNTRITTSLNAGTCLLYVIAYDACDGLVIKDIFFENTHGVIPDATQAVFLYGTQKQTITNATLSGCRFDGFCNAVEGQGVDGWTIDNNTFNSPKGHDNAKNDTDPAVYVWFFDNSNGYCKDIHITNNVADGYTGSGPISSLVTKRAMDGFVYGTGYGFTITGNTTRNFSEEHYLLGPRATFRKDSSQTLFSNNHIDGTIPTGSMDENGSKQHLINYGIRCDISNAVITGNDIRNYTYGIMVRGIDYPKYDEHSYQITGNKLYAATDTVNYSVQTGISIEGNIGNRIKNVLINNNEIHIDQLRSGSINSGILLFDVQEGTVQYNTVMTGNTSKKVQISALAYRRVGKVQEISNQSVGMKFRTILSPTDTVQIFSGQNIQRNQ